MANWHFNPNQYEERSFSIIPEGGHRVRIAEVNERTFSSGNEGYEIVMEVSGHGGKLWYYLVLNRADEAATNQRLGTFFNCFGISNYVLGNGKQWIGKVGGVYVKHEPYNGETKAKVQYLMSKKKQEELPSWQGNAAAQQPQPVIINDDDLPFN